MRALLIIAGNPVQYWGYGISLILLSCASFYFFKPGALMRMIEGEKGAMRQLTDTNVSKKKSILFLVLGTGSLILSLVLQPVV